jgi:hypothetical protein
MVTVYNKICNFKDCLKWIEEIYPDYGERFPFNFYAFRELKDIDETTFRGMLESKLPPIQPIEEDNSDKDEEAPPIDSEFVKQSQDFFSHRQEVIGKLKPLFEGISIKIHEEQLMELIGDGHLDYLPIDKLGPIENYFNYLKSTDDKKKPVYWDDTVARIKSTNETFRKKIKKLEEKTNPKNAGRKKSVEQKPEENSIQKVLNASIKFNVKLRSIAETLHMYTEELPEWIVTLKPAYVICEARKLGEIADNLFEPFFSHSDSGNTIAPYGALII